MADVTVRAVGPVNQGTAATLVLTSPAGQAGDYLVAVLGSQAQAGGEWGLPANFARVGPAAVNPPTSQYRPGGLYILKLTGAPDATYTFTSPSSSTRIYGFLVSLVGVDLTNPVLGSTAWTAPTGSSNTAAIDTAGTVAGFNLEFYHAQYASPNSYALTSGPASPMSLLGTVANPAGAENTGVSRSIAFAWAGVTTGQVPAHNIVEAGPSVARSAYIVTFRSASNAMTQAVSDSSTGTDAVTVDSTRQGSDPATLTDTQAVDRGVTQTDVAVGADALAAVRDSAGTVTDVQSSTDTLSLARELQLSDSLSATDALSALVARTATLADDLAATDGLSVAQAGAASRTATDQMQLSDDFDVAWVRDRALDDQLASTDSAAPAGGYPDGYQGGYGISVPLPVDRGVAFTDPLSATDTTDTPSVRVRALTDTAAATDALAIDRAGLRAAEFTDPLPATDSLLTASTRTRSVEDDPLTATDAVTAAQVRRELVTDPLVILDQIEATWARAAVLADVLRVTDARGQNCALNVNDALTVTDDMVIFAGRPRNLDLTIALLPGRFTAQTAPDRYALDLSGDRYEARVT